MVQRDFQRPTRGFSAVLAFLVVVGAAYEVVLLFTGLLAPQRFPVPFAVPIFDTPFALAAAGIGYLCFERHRLRQDARSASLGFTLGLTALLALAHIATQPDYPGTPGISAGVAPYFFFLSYLGAFAGIGFAAHLGDRPLPLTDRQRLLSVIGAVIVSVVIVLAVTRVEHVLPSLVMKPGRLTPFAVVTGGLVNGAVAVWALWGARQKIVAQSRDRFAGFLLIAGTVWLFGLLGLLTWPYRYGVSWYLAGLARPAGVMVLFVGLLREQVWLYREARARLRDLESLHEAGQMLVSTLDPVKMVETIASRALTVAGADAAVLYRRDPDSGDLRVVARAGDFADPFAPAAPSSRGDDTARRAVAERRPVWSPDVPSRRSHSTRAVPAVGPARGFESVLAVPLMAAGDDVFGALCVFHREERGFVETDLGLLSTFGTQASAAMENARSFDQLAVRARHDAALQDFGQWLLEAATDGDILDDCARVAQALAGATSVGVFLVDGASQTLALTAGIGWPPGVVGSAALPVSEPSLASRAFLDKTMVEADDFTGHPTYVMSPLLAQHGVRAGIALPLGVRDQPVGVLAAYYHEPHRASEEERRVLTTIAHQAALALDKARLYIELQANLKRLQETQAQLIQADKLTALGTLLSGMAHELNNPLSTIQLSVELMKRHPLSEALRKRVDAIDEECGRAARIIRDLLVFARRKAPERLPVDLNRVLSQVLDLQAPDFEMSRIRVVTDLGQVPSLMGDPHQLQQVFLNLFTNARQAMKAAHGQGTLSVRSMGEDDQIVVVIEDDGPGIPADHLSRIFDPFFTTKTAGEGTGLGLSLSIGIVEAHGGRMQVENVAGAGARFTVRLPISGTSAKPAASAASAAATTGQARRGRVLVIDDEERLRTTLVDVFMTLGHDVDQAATGGDGLSLLATKAFDVVVLDLRLPDIDGKAVWEQMVSRDPGLVRKVIFITGDTMSAETQTFLERAGRPVLTKPVTMDQVRVVIGQILDAAPSAAG
jgi:signal transduction histidine kinase/ActR/RegA family two-component response regulator